MMLHFRTRKYGSTVNSSFFLKDGRNLVHDFSHFHIGDRVSISWPGTPERCAALENLDPRAIGRDLYATGEGDDLHIYTGCIVAERLHSLARLRDDGIGDLRTFGMSITFEAANGYVEDMLLWIMLDEKPVWAE